MIGSRMTLARAFAPCSLRRRAARRPAVVGRARARSDPIAEVLQNGSAEWSDGFDTASGGAADVRTIDPDPVAADRRARCRRAITQYSDIVAKGGWPAVPADKMLKIGMRDPAVVVLRQRLAIVRRSAGRGGRHSSDAFDSYVDAAVKRFQARHGIQPDGVIGDTTFAALNVPAHRAPDAARHQSDAAQGC